MCEMTEECDGPNALVVFDKKSATIQRFLPGLDEWHTVENGLTEDMKKWCFTVATFDRNLYIFMNNRSVHRLYQEEGEVSWKRLPSMTMNHGQYPPVLATDDSIYVIGTSGVGRQTDGGERFFPTRNKWIKIKAMRKERRNHALATSDGYVFSIGGASSSGMLCCGERYDPEEEVWKYVPKMKEARQSAAAVAMDNNLYVLGGFATGRRRKDVICLNLTSWEWTSIRHMTLTRTSFVACVVNEKIFAVGGDNGLCDTIEAYSAEEDKWEFLDILATLQIDAAVNLCA